MINKANTTNFTFSVFQGDEKVIERCFNSEIYNPIIRYSVDIRDMIPSITSRLQRVMSSKSLNYENQGYNNLTYYKELVDYYELIENKLTKPSHTKYTHGSKVIKGVECKFGLYINDNPIVERKIYVDNYNPTYKFSTDIVDVVNEITLEISESLKQLDVEHMWGDYILNDTYGLYNNQIRDLSKKKRTELVDNYNNRSFVKNYKNSFKKQES